MTFVALIFSNYGQSNQPFLLTWHKLLKQSSLLHIHVYSRQTKIVDKGVVIYMSGSTESKAYAFLKHWLYRLVNIKIPVRQFPVLQSIQGVCHIVNAQLYHEVKPNLPNTTKVICSFRGYETVVRYQEDEEWRIRLHDIFDSADALHFVSDYLKGEAIKLGAAPTKCTTIYRSVDLDFFSPNPRDENDEIQILSAGRLTWQKGFKHALEAITMLKAKTENFRYTIVGDGEELEPLQQEINRLKLQSWVTIRPHVNHQQLKELYQRSDVLLVSSVTEGLPNVVLEAAAMQLPIVATRVGGIPEALEDGKTGFLVEDKNANEMASALFKLLADEELRFQMGRAAREFISKRFGSEQILKQWEEFYESINVQA
jgi:glycosyltransferase involved in cell wall biosynthesis